MTDQQTHFEYWRDRAISAENDAKDWRRLLVEERERNAKYQIDISLRIASLDMHRPADEDLRLRCYTAQRQAAYYMKELERVTSATGKDSL